MTLAVYEATKGFPREEIYGLTSQMRRASAGIPTNIAEGCGRGSNADLARFLQMALGSATELEYQILLSRDLSFLPKAEYERLTKEVTEVKRMLTAFIKRLRAFDDADLKPDT